MYPEIIRARGDSRTWEICFQRAKWQRKIKSFAHFQAKKATRRNANHFGRPAVHNHVAADRRVLPRKFALPQSITDHGARRATPHAIVLRSKKTSAHRIDSKCIERVAAEPQSARPPHLRAFSQRSGPAVRPRKQIRKNLLMQSNLLPKRIRQCRLVVGDGDAESAVAIFYLHTGQPLRMRHRQAPQTHRIDQLKNSSVRADTQRQRQNCSKPKSPTLPQSPQSKSHILQQRLEPRVQGMRVLARLPTRRFAPSLATLSGARVAALCAGAWLRSVFGGVGFVGLWGCVLAVCSVGGARLECCVGRVRGFAARGAGVCVLGTFLFRAGFGRVFLPSHAGLPQVQDRDAAYYLTLLNVLVSSFGL